MFIPRFQRAAVVLAAVVADMLAPALTSAASLPAPRKSPDFMISEPSGKSTQLSSFKGKVVVMEFLFLQSNHCTHVAKMLNELSKEMGLQGFQAVGVVFDPPNTPESHGALIGPAVDYFKLTYPVGYSSKKDVDAYLNRGPREVLNIPQLVVIDRAGMIQATSGSAGGDPRLEDEDSLRKIIGALLKEHNTSAHRQR